MVSFISVIWFWTSYLILLWLLRSNSSFWKFPVLVTVNSLRNPHPVQKFKLLSSRGRFCSIQFESLDFCPIWCNFVPPTLKVQTSQLGGTILSHPVWKFKLSTCLRQFCHIQLGNLNFLNGWDNFYFYISDVYQYPKQRITLFHVHRQLW